MESKTKFFGHPVHPMLVTIPLGLFVASIVFDTIFVFTKNPLLPGVSFFNISLGILGGLFAAVFGFIDWTSIPAETRAKRIGAWHGVGNVILVLLFSVSWWLRMTAPSQIPSTLALTFSYAGVVLGLLTAWLGGELIYRLSVGPDSNANLNAPNSLSGSKENERPENVILGHHPR